MFEEGLIYTRGLGLAETVTTQTGISEQDWIRMDLEAAFYTEEV